MKTLGMIGGTSWHSTIAYYRYINSMVNDRKGRLVTPPLIIKSINVAVMAENNWDNIRQEFLETSLLLQNAGAEAVIFCANTPHKVYPFVAPKLQIPILHIADATAKAARQQGISKLGLLGTLPVMREAFIAQRMQDQFNVRCMCPEKSRQQAIHELIVEELVQGIFKPEAKTFLLNEMQQLSARGAEGIVLGCTEFPLLVKEEDVDLPLFNTTWLHARMAVDFILGEA